MSLNMDEDNCTIAGKRPNLGKNFDQFNLG